ncbi:MAG: hypothetical protein EZS28_049772, partial [Streblomastix strix]
MINGEWNQDTISGEGDGMKDLIHELIIIEEFVIDKQFQKEGQILIADIARWRRIDESSIGIGNKGPDQKVSFYEIKFLLPEESDVGSCIQLLGNERSNEYGRKIEVKFDQCEIQTEMPNSVIDSYSLIKDEPSFNSSILIANQLKELEDLPASAGSVLSVRGIKAALFPISIIDSSFDNCSCEVNVTGVETKLIGIGGAISICGRNIHAEIIHCTINECYGTLRI